VENLGLLISLIKDIIFFRKIKKNCPMCGREGFWTTPTFEGIKKMDNTLDKCKRCNEARIFRN